MQEMMLVVFYICWLLAGISAQYQGYKVLTINVHDDAVDNLEKFFQEENIDADVWREASVMNSWLDVMLSADDTNKVIEYLIREHLQYDIIVDDVQQYINSLTTVGSAGQQQHVQDFVVTETNGTGSGATKRQARHVARRAPRDAVPGQDGGTPVEISNAVVGRYAPLEEITDWLFSLTQHFTTFTSLHAIGDTHENRTIYAIKIGTDSYASKPAIVIDGGIHAREWVAHASVVYIIYELIRGYLDQDVELVSLVDQVDWYLVPVLNPDGYEYTHSQKRLWRKNRKSYDHPDCTGVDVNRNFPYAWDPPVGANDNACSSVYRGPRAGSEHETQAMMSLLNDTQPHAYFNIHSYSQLWLYCWAHGNYTCENEDNLEQLSDRAVAAMYNSSGVEYVAGKAHEVIYSVSGGSTDWAHGGAGVPYSFALELRDNGTHGFLLPENQALDTGRELWRGVRVVADHVVQEYTYTKDTDARGNSGDGGDSDTHTTDATTSGGAVVMVGDVQYRVEVLTLSVICALLVCGANIIVT